MLSSIRAKLVVLIAALIALVSIFIYQYFPDAMERRSVATMYDKIETLADVTAYHVATALDFNLPDDVREILIPFADVNEIAYVAVLDENGDVYAEYANGNDAIPPVVTIPTGTAFDASDQFFQVRKPIDQAGRTIGTVVLVASLSELRASIADGRTWIAAVSAIIFCMGLIAVLVIGYVITGPLRHMVDTASRIADGDLTQRANVASRDEVGRLATAFNRMVERVHASQTELQQVNQSLEARVRERTETLQIEVEERKLAESVAKRAAIEAERANQAKTEFLARMSHELRTPMNAVLGFAQLLRRDQQLPERQRSRAEQIVQSGTHLLELINEILDLARIEAGQLSLSPENINLLPVVDEVLSIVRPLASERRIDLVNALNETDFTVYADRTRLRQVLLNLLSNGVKYNRLNGTVTLSVETIDDAKLRISVVDTGNGIPEHRQGDMFQPFNRLGMEDSAIEGTGIGLAVSKRLVEAMHGSIGFKSVAGEGSEFYIDLNLATKPDDPRWTRDRSVGANRIGGNLPAISVLYIEDNPTNMELIRDIFDEGVPNASLQCAEDGPTGIQMARQMRPDLVLLDIHMPDMDGFAVFAQLRQAPETKDTIIVALSADAMPRDIEKAMDAGFDHYLTKPLDVEELIRVIDRVTLRIAHR